MTVQEYQQARREAAFALCTLPISPLLSICGITALAVSALIKNSDLKRTEVPNLPFRNLKEVRCGRWKAASIRILGGFVPVVGPICILARDRRSSQKSQNCKEAAQVVILGPELMCIEACLKKIRQAAQERNALPSPLPPRSTNQPRRVRSASI